MVGLFNMAAAQQSAGELLYMDRCASCHGSNLEGQANWMTRLPNGRLPAPPHDETGHTWHHSDGQLFRIVKEGLASIVPGYETDMPAFGTSMTDEEIMAVIDYIKSTWPPREQDYQRRRTEAETD